MQEMRESGLSGGMVKNVKNVKKFENVRFVGNRRQEAFDPRKGLECKLEITRMD